MKYIILFLFITFIYADISIDSSNLNSNIKKTTNKAYKYNLDRKKRAREVRENQSSGSTGYYSGADMKNMCLGASRAYPDLCYNVKDSNLKNTCLGMTKYPELCYNIKNKDLKNFCLGTSGQYRDLCYNIKDKDLKNACLGISRYRDNCYSIQDNNIKSMCIGISQHSDNCYNIR